MVERNLAKVEVDGSNPFARSKHSSGPLRGPVRVSRARVPRLFEISDGEIIPPGRYSWDRFCTRGGKGEHRQLRVTGYVCAGEFYDGDRDTVSANLTWRPSKHFRIGGCCIHINLVPGELCSV